MLDIADVRAPVWLLLQVLPTLPLFVVAIGSRMVP
jgi:hypothetical protein